MVSSLLFLLRCPASSTLQAGHRRLPAWRAQREQRRSPGSEHWTSRLSSIYLHQPITETESLKLKYNKKVFLVLVGSEVQLIFLEDIDISGLGGGRSRYSHSKPAHHSYPPEHWTCWTSPWRWRRWRRWWSWWW